ncbi:MAG: prepilin-type N-terminal cleavage/methylation domain-containing protein [Candidatus Brocadiae bacterium]|nr:prepilin-type N-terminal cleavage/methylation domain-containing protein [Candidatus Brocadiia bacterium]
MKIKNIKGFSLLEVMVALAILSLSVTTLLVIRNNSIEQAGRARELRRTKILLEQKMGEIVCGMEKRRSGGFQEEGYQNYVWSVDSKETKVRSSADPAGKIHEIGMTKVVVYIRHKDAQNKFQQSMEAYFLAENPENAPEEDKKTP